MASSELEVKEISELNDVSITDDALALTYTEKDGVGKSSFQNIKKYLGAEISVKTSATSSANGGTNTISVSTRNGETNATKTFSVKNGQGINSIVKTESVDANGLRQNQINITASESENSVNATIKDGVGIKTHTTTASTDANGLKTNTLAIAYTDGKSNSVAIKDGVGIRQASQTTSSSISGGLNEYTIKLTDGTTTKIQVYNGAAGKDFRIAKTYTSVAAMKADFSGTSVKTYEFAMIDTGSVQDIDTGKLYCKGTTEWTYIGDLSGAQGIKGETGNGISSITNTQNSDGNIDVKITMTNGTSKTFTVLNGINVVAGNGISINDKFVVSISDNLSSLISDIQSLANTNKNDISSIKSVNASQTNSIISLGESIGSLQSDLAKIVGESLKSLQERPYIQDCNLEQNGYVKWSNGFLIQWGRGSSNETTSGSYKTIYFPIAYSKIFTAVATGRPSSQWNEYALGIYEFTNTYFKTSEKYSNYCSWIAIGLA